MTLDREAIEYFSFDIEGIAQANSFISSYTFQSLLAID